MQLEDFLTRLNGVKKTRNGFEARCPAHDDQRASLGLTEGNGGKILINCLAGCRPGEIVKVLGLAMTDLFNDAIKQKNNAGKIIKQYDYTDETGSLLFQVVRYEPKNFRQRRPDGRGAWNWETKSTRKVLYRLPEIIASKMPVIIVEGEKSADRLRAEAERAGIELCATCSPMGAGKWRNEYNETLRDRQVFIVPDNDEAGLNHAKAVFKALWGIAAGVVIATLPDLPPQGDVVDYLGQEHTLADFLTVLDNAWQQSLEEGLLRPVEMSWKI